MNCPTDQQLSAFHDGELPVGQQAEMSRHLAFCKACLRRMEQLKHISSLVGLSAPNGISQIALRRLHLKLDEVIERGLVRWAWEVSGIAAAILLAGSIWLSQVSDPSSTASASVPPWVVSRASADPVVSESVTSSSVTPAAAWYLVDARNNSDLNP